jgi:hypothetical protein
MFLIVLKDLVISSLISFVISGFIAINLRVIGNIHQIKEIMENRNKFLILTLIIAFFILEYGITLNPIWNTRDDLRPREGISIGHNDPVQINKIDFFIINTRDTDSIELRYTARYLDHSTIGKVGIYFPYHVDMTTNSTGWEKTDVGLGTAFMKIYACNQNDYCRTDFDEQPIFTLNPEHTKFDSKNIYQHGIKIKFNDVVPTKADEFFRSYNMQDDPLSFTYGNSTKRQASIVIPRTADHIHPIPMAEPDVFHNGGNDYSNNRLYWNLHNNDPAFFLDYEMPDERTNYDHSQLLITMSGIVMGIIVGVLGISASLFNKTDKDTHYKIYR